MEMPAQAAPASSPVAAAPVKRRKPWVRILFAAFKAIYIVGGGLFSIWVASFAPVGSPSLTTFVPPRAGVIFHVRDGSRLLKGIVDSSAAAELREDPDLNEINGLKDRLDNWRNAPRFVRWLLPYRVDTFFPVVGKEILYAIIVPVSNPGEEPPTSTDGKKKHAHRAEERLLLTQLSGGRGHLLRIIAQFWKPRDAEFYDLGGGAVALGYNGGKPVFNPAAASKQGAAVTSPTEDGGLEIARIEIYPPIIQGKPIEPDEVKNSPIGPRLADLAESTARALLRPPGPMEIMNTHETPKEISLSFYSSPDGVIARGQIVGGVPALPDFNFDPAREMPTAQDKDNLKPYAEGLLPIDGKAAFFAYVSQQLAVKPAEPPNTTRRLSSKQQRLLDKLAAIEDDVDLDRDIWPMGGHSVRFRVDNLPPEYNQIGYGLLRTAIPLDAAKPETRLAAKHLVGIGWNVYDREKPAPKDAKQPYVQEITTGELDRYIVVNGQGWAPTIAISNHCLSIVSDAGPYALLDTGAAHSAEPHPEKPQSYFIRLDGRRLAASVETFARSWYESEEKDIGSQKFLKDHPHSAAWIALNRKLTGLLGDFSISLTPTVKGNGAIDLVWKPGTTKVEGAKLPQARGVTNSVPAPPPSDDSPAPAPPPPPD